jgi:ABC-2 type transport system permease protein
MLNGDEANESFDAVRFTLLTIGYLIYLGIFVAVSLAVSARAVSSRFALLALLGFWILSCLIAPRVATDIARKIHPTPSALSFAAQMENDIKNGADGHNPSDKRLADLKIETMQQYGVSKLEDLPINFDGIALQAGEDFSNQVFDEHYGNLWNQFERQDTVRQISAVFAPQLAIGSLSRGLAGTDFAQHRDFAAAAENHRRLLIRTINDDVKTNAKYGDTKYVAAANLWEKVPEFQYVAPETSEILRKQIVGILILCCWFIASILAMIWATARMRA